MTASFFLMYRILNVIIIDASFCLSVCKDLNFEMGFIYILCIQNRLAIVDIEHVEKTLHTYSSVGTAQLA
jgi:hypothetical protein